MLTFSQHAESRIINDGTTNPLPQAFRAQDSPHKDSSGPSLLKRPVITRPATARAEAPSGMRSPLQRTPPAGSAQRPKPATAPRAPRLPPRSATPPAFQAVKAVVKTAIHDIDNAYRLLGLAGEVDGMYLDPLYEARTNRTIAAARRLLQLAYHPDLVEDRLLETQEQKTAQARKTESMSAAINAAYDRVRDRAYRRCRSTCG